MEQSKPKDLIDDEQSNGHGDIYYCYDGLVITDITLILSYLNLGILQTSQNAKTDHNNQESHEINEKFSCKRI